MNSSACKCQSCEDAIIYCPASCPADILQCDTGDLITGDILATLPELYQLLNFNIQMLGRYLLIQTSQERQNILEYASLYPNNLSITPDWVIQSVVGIQGFEGYCAHQDLCIDHNYKKIYSSLEIKEFNFEIYPKMYFALIPKIPQDYDLVLRFLNETPSNNIFS